MISKFLLVASAFTAASLASAVTYDAFSDFSTASNPNGAWSYGYRNSNPTDTFQLATAIGNFNGFGACWSPSNQSRPVIGTHTGASFYDAPTTSVYMHTGVAGPEPVIADLRWTAAQSGIATVTADVYAGDVGRVDLYVYKNGVSIASTLDTATSFSLQQAISVSAGDVFDFMVGAGTDGANSDTTPLNVSISQPVPEPCSLIAVGLGFAAFARRRRS